MFMDVSDHATACEHELQADVLRAQRIARSITRFKKLLGIIVTARRRARDAARPHMKAGSQQ